MNPIAKLFQDIRFWAFLGILAFLFFHHQFGYFGHYGFDDVMGYGFYAKKWAEGHYFFLDEDFFSYRWGFVAPTGLFYAIFGMSDASSAILPSLMLLSTVLLIFKALKSHLAMVGVIAACIFCFDNWTMYYSDKLMPDTTVAFAAFAAFFIVYQQRFISGKRKDFQNALWLTLVLIWAYMTKQSILLLAPVFLVLMVIDFYHRRHQKFWIMTAVFCILAGLLYLLGIYALTGNPFSRFLAVEAGLDDNLGEGHSFAFCNYAVQPWSVLIYRIGLEMIDRFMGTGLMFSMILALPALFLRKFRKLLKTEAPQSFWTLVLLLSFLSANFMTTSYKAYLPICPDIRHFLFLVPIAAVVAAPLVFDFVKSLKFRQKYLTVCILILGLAFWRVNGNMVWLYSGLTFIVVLRSILPINKWSTHLTLLGLLGLALMPVLSSMNAARNNGYIEQRTLIYTYFKGNPHPSIVISNKIQQHFGKYLMEFDKNAPTRFYNYQEMGRLSYAVDTSVYILANKMTRNMSGLQHKDLPPAIQYIQSNKNDSSIEVLYQSDKMTLYKLNQPEILK